MHVASPPPPRLSPRGSSAARARRPYLRFAPLARPAAEEGGEDASAVSLSLTSVSQSFMSSPTADATRGRREELILMRPSPPMASGKPQKPQPQQQRRQRKSACSSSISSSRSSSSSISGSSRRDGSQSHGGRSYEKVATPSPRSSFLFSDISSSFDDEYRRRSATRCTVQPLSEDETALVNAAYKRYVQSTDKPGCLLIFLQELGASDNPADYEVWLQQLEKFICISRDQLVGSSMTSTEATEESGKTLGKQQRVLTEEEVVYFATWLKTTRGELFGPRSTPRSASILVNGSKYTTPSSSSLAGTNTTTTMKAVTATVEAGAEEEKDSNHPCNDHSDDENGSAKGKKGRRINWRDARKALAPVFTQEREKSSPRPTRPTSSSMLHSPNPLPPRHTPTPSARGLLLERRAFAELGGGQDGSGAVRLVDLKRMLRSFHVEANFDACVGRTIDMDRSGWINFEEFLWVLEYGVRGEGPAADIHAYLPAPLNESAASNQSPQRPRSRTPHSHQRGKNNYHQNTTTSTNTSHNNSLSTLLSSRRRRRSRRSNRSVRLPAVRCNSARRREKAAGRPISARGHLSAVEDIRREFLSRIVKMSPYAASAEPVRRPQQHYYHSPEQQTGKLQPHPPRRRSHMRSAHSRPRAQTSRAKTAGPRTCGADSFDKGVSSPQREAAARKLQLLREQQTRLTKRLKSLTALPSCDKEARERSEELQSLQDELNTVLDHIAATMRDLTVAGERVDGERDE